MSVKVHVSWNPPGGEQVFDLEGEFRETGDNDGVVSVHTSGDSMYINIQETRLVWVSGTEE